MASRRMRNGMGVRPSITDGRSSGHVLLRFSRFLYFMGNPYPTKSKPIKIGRKHTGESSLRVIGQQKSGLLQKQKSQTSNFRKYKNLVAAYWKGEVDGFPPKPKMIVD